MPDGRVRWRHFHGEQAAARIAPIPLLVVHGDQDLYFPPDHAEQLYAAAGDPKELWIVPGFGHAESAARFPLLDRIGRWVREPTAAGEVSSGTDEARQDSVGADS